MGYNTYTTTDMVNNILLTSHMPTGNQTFTSQKIITLADRELQLPLMKQILATRGGYYLTYQDYEVAADGLYIIPSDAIGGMLADVQLIQGPTIVPVNIIEPSEQFSTDSPTSTSYGCFFRGNYVQILPIPPIGNPRFWFFKRTSKLIPTNQACQITSINGTIITVASVPSNIVIGATIDVLGDQPPFNILGEREIVSITGTDIELDLEVDLVAVGDWIALNKQSPIPQIPVEFRTSLEQRVVCKIYELQGYLDKLAAAKQVLKELEESIMGMMTPRIQSQTKVINPINGGFLSGNQNRLTNFPAGRL
jgi:hypothetical protein